LFKFHTEGTTSREFHTWIQSFGQQCYESTCDQDSRDHVENATLSDEVKIEVLERPFRHLRIEWQVTSFLHPTGDDEAGNYQCRKHGCEDTDDEGGCE